MSNETANIILLYALITIYAYQRNINSWIAARCAYLLADVNSYSHFGFESWKTRFFYPFKTHFRVRFATRKGYARQFIDKGECYACHNYYEDDGDCTHCGGTGIHKETYYLRVYKLARVQFLVPLNRRPMEYPSDEILFTIEGKIKHPKIPFEDACRALVILFLLFDVRGFLWHVRRELNNYLYNHCGFYEVVRDEIEHQVMLWKQTIHRDDPDYYGADEIPF